MSSSGKNMLKCLAIYSGKIASVDESIQKCLQALRQHLKKRSKYNRNIKYKEVEKCETQKIPIE